MSLHLEKFAKAKGTSTATGHPFSNGRDGRPGADRGWPPPVEATASCLLCPPPGHGGFRGSETAFAARRASPSQSSWCPWAAYETTRARLSACPPLFTDRSNWFGPWNPGEGRTRPTRIHGFARNRASNDTTTEPAHRHRKRSTRRCPKERYRTNPSLPSGGRRMEEKNPCRFRIRTTPVPRRGETHLAVAHSALISPSANCTVRLFGCPRTLNSRSMTESTSKPEPAMLSVQLLFFPANHAHRPTTQRRFGCNARSSRSLDPMRGA